MGNYNTRLPQQAISAHFIPLKLLGKGNFAKVYLVKHKQDQTLYALKLSPKAKMRKENKLLHIINERNILEGLHHTCITELCYSFQDNLGLFMILEFADSGDLRSHMKAHLWSENDAMFVISEIACGLTYLHKKKIVHRDIKPENILMDSLGHVFISDFNVAIRQQSGLPIRSVAGTEPYMAPEILNHIGYHAAVDWWSLGVVLFEIIHSERPFRTRNRREFIKKGAFTFPYHIPAISSACKDAISRFLAFEPTQRMGFEKIGLEMLYSHPFFVDIPWKDVGNKKYAPPYRPSMDDPHFMHSPPTVEGVDEDFERLILNANALPHIAGDMNLEFDQDVISDFFYYNRSIDKGRPLPTLPASTPSKLEQSNPSKKQLTEEMMGNNGPDYFNSFHGTTNATNATNTGNCSRRPSRASILGRRTSVSVPSDCHTPIMTPKSRPSILSNTSSKCRPSDSFSILPKLFKGLGARCTSKNLSEGIHSDVHSAGSCSDTSRQPSNILIDTDLLHVTHEMESFELNGRSISNPLVPLQQPLLQSMTNAKGFTSRRRHSISSPAFGGRAASDKLESDQLGGLQNKSPDLTSIMTTAMLARKYVCVPNNGERRSSDAGSCPRSLGIDALRGTNQQPSGGQPIFLNVPVASGRRRSSGQVQLEAVLETGGGYHAV
ncbi:hypothetical protein QVD99_000825 [Batrachochytrium dendrobatidis]|nr:hypothetical protein QVD99_000825 [Batrachochytrium dendrobatidis]